MYDSGTVANHFLRLARQQGKSLTPMQLLKLVYIAHGWSLGLYGLPLVRDEIQAWQYGPVIPNLYNRIRNYRSLPILTEVHSMGSDLGAREVDLVPVECPIPILVAIQ